MSHNHSAHLKSECQRSRGNSIRSQIKMTVKIISAISDRDNFFVYNLRVKILNRRFPPTVQQCQALVCRSLLTTRRPGSIGEQRDDGADDADAPP